MLLFNFMHNALFYTLIIVCIIVFNSVFWHRLWLLFDFLCVGCFMAQ